MCMSDTRAGLPYKWTATPNHMIHKNQIKHPSIASVLAAVIILTCPGRADSTPLAENLATPDAAGRKLVCEMFGKHLAILDQRGQDGKAGPGAPGSEPVAWLAKQDFSGFGARQRQDLESWRNALREFAAAPGSGFARGEKSWQPMKLAMAALASFEVDGGTARANGFPGVAADIDRLLALAKQLVLAMAGQDLKQLEGVRLPVRMFVEYFYIFNILAGAEKRNPIVQAALLSMRPEKVVNPKEREELAQLHEAMLDLCRAHPTDGDIMDMNTLLAIQAMLDAMNNLKITDADLAQVGGEKLLTRMSSIRKWRGNSK